MTQDTSINPQSVVDSTSGQWASWYLLACKPRQEKRAVQNLKNQSVTVCCPQVTVKKIVRGKHCTTTEPLFPGYLFIQIEPSDPAWPKIRSTYGVRDWVRFGGQPAKVPSPVIARLLEHSELPTIDTTISPGSPVRIESGPFAGLEAVFQKEDGESRSLLLVEFLGKNHAISVDNRVIQPLSR